MRLIELCIGEKNVYKKNKDFFMKMGSIFNINTDFYDEKQNGWLLLYH